MSSLTREISEKHGLRTGNAGETSQELSSMGKMGKTGGIFTGNNKMHDMVSL